jgi:hypothetical protein
VALTNVEPVEVTATDAEMSGITHWAVEKKFRRLLGVTASVALVPATASASVANSTFPAAVVEAAGTSC